MRSLQHAFTLIEVILAMTVLSVVLVGVFSVYTLTVNRSVSLSLDFELETVAQNISRDIGRLKVVSASSNCTDTTTDLSRDVCWWEINAQNELPLDSSYFQNKFPSLDQDFISNSLASKGYTVKVSKVGDAFDRNSDLDAGFTCPVSSDSCIYKDYLITVEHPRVAISAHRTSKTCI